MRQCRGWPGFESEPVEGVPAASVCVPGSPQSTSGSCACCVHTTYSPRTRRSRSPHSRTPVTGRRASDTPASSTSVRRPHRPTATAPVHSMTQYGDNHLCHYNVC